MAIRKSKFFFNFLLIFLELASVTYVFRLVGIKLVLDVKQVFFKCRWLGKEFIHPCLHCPTELCPASCLCASLASDFTPVLALPALLVPCFLIIDYEKGYLNSYCFTFSFTFFWLISGEMGSLFSTNT